MIKLLFKYGVFIYLINTIFLSIEATFNLGDYIFLGIMALFGVLIFISPFLIREVLFHKAFTFLLIMDICFILIIVALNIKAKNRHQIIFILL